MGTVPHDPIQPFFALNSYVTEYAYNANGNLYITTIRDDKPRPRLTIEEGIAGSELYALKGSTR